MTNVVYERNAALKQNQKSNKEAQHGYCKNRRRRRENKRRGVSGGQGPHRAADMMKKR